MDGMITPETLFSMLADPTRLRILVLLQSEEELCVCEFTHALKESQPKISRHLGVLREVGLVTARREGVWMHYRIRPRLPSWAKAVFDEVLSRLPAQAPFRGDAERLRRMGDRPGQSSCQVA